MPIKCPGCGSSIEKGNKCDYCGSVVDAVSFNTTNFIGSSCLRCGSDNLKNEVLCKNCNFPIQLKCSACSEYSHIRQSNCIHCGKAMNDLNYVFESVDKDEIIRRSLSMTDKQIDKDNIILADYYLSFAWAEDRSNNVVLIKKAKIKALSAIKASYHISTANAKVKYINESEKLLSLVSDKDFMDEKKEVVKLLDESRGKASWMGKGDAKGSCFIATATMGDYDHPVVMQLREFRDQYLLQRDWGKTFTRYYYKFGPYPANIISKSYLLKRLSYALIVQPLFVLAKKILNK